MNIGEASKRTGLPVKTIRYYEEIELLVADRQANGYRDYSVGDVQKLSFVKRAREFGFSIEDCRRLLDLYGDPDRASSVVKALAVNRLEDLKLKAAEIEHLAATLENLIINCAGDSRADCPIIDELSYERSPRIAQGHNGSADSEQSENAKP